MVAAATGVGEVRAAGLGGKGWEAGAAAAVGCDNHDGRAGRGSMHSGLVDSSITCTVFALLTLLPHPLHDSYRY